MVFFKDNNGALGAGLSLMRVLMTAIGRLWRCVAPWTHSELPCAMPTSNPHQVKISEDRAGLCMKVSTAILH